MSREIGWIGLGRMGEAMVKRLTQAGYDVKVWNRTRSKAEPLVAVRRDDRRRASQDLAGCDVVFTMVSTTDDLKEVLFGDGGLVTGAPAAGGRRRQLVDLAGGLGRDPRAARRRSASPTCARRSRATRRSRRPASC